MKGYTLTPPRINPILLKELRTRMRGVRPYGIITLFLITLIASGYGIYHLVLEQQQFGIALMSAHVGQAIFTGLALWLVFLVVFLAPALTSSAISVERELLTYDMLMATPLKPVHLLWGKLMAALSYLVLLIVAAIPVFSVVLMFGGVTSLQVFKTLTLLVATAVTYGSIGLFFSALFRRTLTATIVSYIIVLLMIGGTFIASSIWSRSFMWQPESVPPMLVYLNPFSALVSIVALVPSQPMDPSSSSFPISFIGGPFGSLPLLEMFSPGVISYDMEGRTHVVPIFRATLVCFTMMTVLLCWASSHLIRHRARWSLQSSDLSFALLFLALLLLAWMIHPWWFVLPPSIPNIMPMPIPVPLG